MWFKFVTLAALIFSTFGRSGPNMPIKAYGMEAYGDGMEMPWKPNMGPTMGPRGMEPEIGGRRHGFGGWDRFNGRHGFGGGDRFYGRHGFRGEKRFNGRNGFRGEERFMRKGIGMRERILPMRGMW